MEVSCRAEASALRWALSWGLGGMVACGYLFATGGADFPEAKPQTIPTLKMPTGRGWTRGQTPVAAPGLKVNAFCNRSEASLWMQVLPNGDVLVAEALPTADPIKTAFDYAMFSTMKRAAAVGISPNRITLLRDADGDGVAEARHVFLDGLNQPFGMALIGDTLYIGNTDGLIAFPYTPGVTRIPTIARPLAGCAGVLSGFADGMVIGQHGSWNRSKLSGYKVIFVPFANGRPAGPPRDILSGFLAPDERASYGRPVGVAMAQDGSARGRCRRRSLARHRYRQLKGFSQRRSRIHFGCCPPKPAICSRECSNRVSTRQP